MHDPCGAVPHRMPQRQLAPCAVGLLTHRVRSGVHGPDDARTRRVRRPAARSGVVGLTPQRHLTPCAVGLPTHRARSSVHWADNARTRRVRGPAALSGAAVLIVFLSASAIAGIAAQPEAIFRDPLRGPALDRGWSVDASAGNTVAVKPDFVEITAAEHTYAHLERPLGIDNVRVSCAIRPGSGISWAASLFLYWQPGDWCQMGIITRGGGRHYVCLASGAGRDEHDLSPCRLDGWRYVAIELAEDAIRFLSSPDGREWHSEIIVPRPPSLQGPPALLVVGKGYGLDAGHKDLDSDYGDRGAPAVSMVRDVLVVATPPARRRFTAEERREQQLADADPLGAKVLSAAADPSFESVAPLLPPLAKPREAIGVKDHPLEVGIRHDGTIEIGQPGDGWQTSGKTVFFMVGTPPVRFGSGGCTKRLLRGYLPVVTAEFRHDGLLYEQTAMGCSEGMSPDKDLRAYIRLKITNPTPRERTTPVALQAAPPVTAEVYRARDLTIAAGAEREIVFRVPVPMEGRDAAEADPAEFKRRLDETCAHWATILQAGMQITVPEQRVNDACRAWLAYNFLDVDKQGDRFMPHDGAGFYEAVFGYSAALYCNALDLWGYHQDSRRYLESLLGLLSPEGLFFASYGLPDQGALLMALSNHYRMTGDEEWLRGVSPKMRRMCDWIIAKRKESMKTGAPGRPVTYGLIRFTPYADYQEHTVDYYGDAYSCVGLERAADVLGRIGMGGEAARLAREAADYRSCIMASMDAAAIERDAMKLLPMEPDTHRLLKATRYKAGGYYGLVASMMLESQFLPPSDPRARWVTDALERRGGLILGMCEFDRGVDHAYTYGYWLNCLARDEVRRVLLGFYASLAYGMGRDTYTGVEVTQVLTGEPTPTMPHLYSGTQQLRLLRMMLVRELGEDLLVGQAMPRHWLGSGKRVEIRRAPTVFGPLSLAIESEADRGRINVTIDPPARRPPRSILLRLRHPRSRPIQAVTVNGVASDWFTGDTVTLTPADGPMTVEVTYR